jgi:type II secretory pathway pseudopilin PulG
MWFERAGYFRRVHSAAFTLVEVVIAVGLVAFVLTAILGLVAIAINETKNADLKVRLTWITEQVTSEFQSQRFATALASVPTNGSAIFYWDYSGTRLPNSNLSGFKCNPGEFLDEHGFAAGQYPVASAATDIDKC